MDEPPLKLKKVSSFENNSEMVKIAVIGAGVAGLSSAVNIQKMMPEAKVTIIADKFGCDTTSYGAGGIFRPFLDDYRGNDIEQAKGWITDSWEYYYHLATSSQAWDSGNMLVSGVLCYRTSKDEQYSLLAKLAYDFRRIPPEEMKRRNYNYEVGYFYTTVITQTPKYLAWLTNKFQEAGGMIENKTVLNLADLCGKYDLVVNCCGLGAEKLLNDKEMFPVRGHLVSVDAPWMKHFFFTEDNCYMIPRADKLIIGGTREKGNYNMTPDLKTRETIMSRAEAFHPQLKGATVLGDWVGLRPGRSKVRLETEIVDCKNKGKLPVVHNYGHGGHGITLGWGTGIAAAKLACEFLGNTKSRL